MKVLLTGGFGIVGLSVIDELRDRGHELSILDLKTKKNKKSARRLKVSSKNIIWGDVRNFSDVKKAIEGCECILHLAAIVPPKSEDNELICNDINIKGTENIINADKALENPIPIIFISSASVMGPTQHLNPPIITSMDVNPITFYARSKVKSENLIGNSGLEYCILRLASVMDSGSDYSDDMLTLLFEFPLDGRNEIVLDSDAASAIVTASEKLTKKDGINGITLFIGGGYRNGCQLKNRELISGMFNAMGIGMISEKCFTHDLSKFSMDWYETAKSNDLLNYQKNSFRDYLKIVKKKTESGGLFVKYMAPRLKSAMQLQSPYYKESIKE